MLDANLAHACSQPDFPAFAFHRRAAAFVQVRERHRRNAHSIATPAAEKRLPENFDPVACVGPGKLFIERAHQHHAPETLDRAARLLHALQPIEHRNAFDIRRRAACPSNREHRSCDSVLVRKRQRAKKQKRWRHVQRWRKQGRRLHRRTMPLRIRKKQLVVEANFPRRTHAAVKIREVRAAAERHVLAVVHFAAVGQRVGSSASAQMGTLLQQPDFEIPLQPARRRRKGPPDRRRSPERFARASLFHQPALPQSPPSGEY